MAGSYATTALNVGAAAGPLLAATTLTSPAADRGPLWVSALLVVTALLIALPARAVLLPDRRGRPVAGHESRLSRPLTGRCRPTDG